jgi:aryl-alcohol dehydrogenase-like predicted oxidoreductase
MRMKSLGNSDLSVSAVGIGCMNFGAMCDQAATDAIVGAALDSGVNLFDVADIYGGPSGRAEELLGQALGTRRRDVIVATKFGARTGGRGGAADGGGSRKYIFAAVEESLARLGTDFIDLYQHHFPDPATPIDETLRALDDLVAQGKVRHVGCSNYTGAQLEAAQAAAAADALSGFVTAQNRYSLLTRDIEAELVPVCARSGVGILPYFPLESGLLTGKYRKDQPLPAGSRFARWRGGGIFASDARYAIVAELESYGRGIGHSVLDLAIGWLAAQPHVSSVIAGVTAPAQVRANVAAATWMPSAAQLADIARIAGAAA